MKIGDEVRIVINDDLNPDNPAFYKSGKEESSSGTKKYCSFCSKERKETKILVHSEDKYTYICGECIVYFNKIIEDENIS
ncbi:MAG: hypothetical protein GWN11_05055 [Candidatus Dadabacteria bacterium]|nr:hypothetical protein [Candidatus Dadabacteria bacterium]NIX15245.1 hypothetical protein [Candidatus Dadabacteria bacterium]